MPPSIITYLDYCSKYFNPVNVMLWVQSCVNTTQQISVIGNKTCGCKIAGTCYPHNTVNLYNPCE